MWTSQPQAHNWVEILEFTNFKLAHTQSNGNTSAGFGRVVTTGFTSTQNYYPRQGVLVGRFTF